MYDIFILCNRKRQGNSAHLLEQELEKLDIRAYRVTPHRRPAYNPGRVTTVINYGVNDTPIWAPDLAAGCVWYNTPAVVNNSSDKREMFDIFNLSTIPVVQHTTFRGEAQLWLDRGAHVVARMLTRGSQGRGIVLSPPDTLPDAPLYTKLYRGWHTREYRVYIVGQRAIDITEKRRWSAERRLEANIDTRNPYTRYIRNNHNGWVFARNNTEATQAELGFIKGRAEQAAIEFGLDWGCIDMIVSRDRESGELNDPVVVETNAAISLRNDSNTLEAVARAFHRRLVNE